MQSWFSHFADSDPDWEREDPPSTGPAEHADTGPVREPDPLDYQLLVLSLSGTRRQELADRFTLTLEDLDSRLAGLAEVKKQLTVTLLADVTSHADVEPVTHAKVEASGAMRRLVAQAKQERDPKVRLAANQAILRYAGVEPAKKVEFTTPDRVLEQMTPQELAAFAASRIWPERFRSALRAFMPTAIDVTPNSPPPKPSNHIPTED